MIVYFILSFIPLVGTSIGAILGIFNNFNNKFEKQEETLVAVATGILVAISFNLLFEACEYIRNVNLFIGIIAGFFFIALMNFFTKKEEQSNLRSKLFWAMLIHNIPEGIIIGIALSGKELIQSATLIFSISLQNVPDGLVVSMPIVSTHGKKRALFMGIISGVVEPLAALLIVIATENTLQIQAFEPLLIGFSVSTILMITLELKKECKKNKVMIITVTITALLNGILS